VPPTYVSRPVAAPPAPVKSFTERAREAELAQRKSRFPSPTAWARRRLSWSLATHPYVRIGIPGFLTIATTVAFLLVGALATATFAPVAKSALESGSITQATAQLSSAGQAMLQMAAILLAVLLMAGLVTLAIFIGLSTHNAVNLGAERTYLGEGKAGTTWFHLVWIQALVAVSLIVPAALIANGYPIPGLILALVAVEVGQHRMDDPFGWLTDPARQLTDLYVKLGMSGLSRSRLASTWRFFFITANSLLVATAALPMLVAGATAVADLTGRSDLIDWPGPDNGPVQIVIIAVLAALAVTAAVTAALLVPVSIELVARQRTRRELARAGRSRPWSARPDAPPPERTLFDPYARFDSVEPDQASLNSPSTTSSSAFEDGSSGSGWPPG
jgi:hypothetical protein